MFENLKKDSEIATPKDSIGGVSGLLRSDLYDATIEVAYIEASKHGAIGIVFHFQLDNKQYYRQTIYVTNRDGKHIWEKDDGRKGYLPGFTLFDEMCTVITGKEASELPDPETKTIKVYNFTTRKEQPTEKQVLTALVGKRLKLGIIQMKEDHYRDTTCWSEKNEIDKVFTIDGITAQEGLAGIVDGEFAKKWQEKRKGEVLDKRKKSAAGDKYIYKAPNAGETASTADTAPKTSLFSQNA